jgi:hypothetical protein
MKLVFLLLKKRKKSTAIVDQTEVFSAKFSEKELNHFGYM